jgi:hypothetical protein
MFRPYKASCTFTILKYVSFILPDMRGANDSLDDGTYHLISACKDGNPMLRSWIGDWIGTFLGMSLFQEVWWNGTDIRSQGSSVVYKAIIGRLEGSNR